MSKNTVAERTYKRINILYVSLERKYHVPPFLRQLLLL